MDLDIDPRSLEIHRAALRSCWEFPAFYQFASLFRVPLLLPTFSLDDLELWLVRSCCVDVENGLLPELHWKLYYAGMGEARTKKYSDWHKVIQKTSTYLLDIPYRDMSLADKLSSLLSLSNRALEICPNLVQNYNETPDILRMYPIGYDASKAAYYWFSRDAWIFKELPPKLSKNKSSFAANSPVWSVAASTLAEVRELSVSLTNSEDAAQRSLLGFIDENVLRPLEAAEKSRISIEHKKALAAALPRRRSSRVQATANEIDSQENEDIYSDGEL